MLNSEFSDEQIEAISSSFDDVRDQYIEMHGEENLKRLNEFHTVRLPLAHDMAVFLGLALNENLLGVVKRLIQGS